MLRAVTIWVVLLAGCASERADRDRARGEDAGRRESPASGAAELELGQGELAFAPLAEGDELPYVAGGQGGHHVFVSFRMRGLDPIRVLFEVTTVVEGFPDLELTRRGRQSFEAESEESWLYVGWPAQILDAPKHRGERARIDVELEDRLGVTVSAHATIVIGGPAQP